MLLATAIAISALGLQARDPDHQLWPLTSRKDVAVLVFEPWDLIGQVNAIRVLRKYAIHVTELRAPHNSHEAPRLIGILKPDYSRALTVLDRGSLTANRYLRVTDSAIPAKWRQGFTWIDWQFYLHPSGIPRPGYEFIYPALTSLMSNLSYGDSTPSMQYCRRDVLGADGRITYGWDMKAATVRDGIVTSHRNQVIGKGVVDRWKEESEWKSEDPKKLTDSWLEYWVGWLSVNPPKEQVFPPSKNQDESWELNDYSLTSQARTRSY